MRLDGNWKTNKTKKLLLHKWLGKEQLAEKDLTQIKIIPHLLRTKHLRSAVATSTLRRKNPNLLSSLKKREVKNTVIAKKNRQEQKSSAVRDRNRSCTSSHNDITKTNKEQDKKKEEVGAFLPPQPFHNNWHHEIQNLKEKATGNRQL